MKERAVPRPAEWLSWGRVVRAEHKLVAPRHRDEAAAAFDAARRAGGGVLAVGLGRSYGDSGLNQGGALIDMRGLDRLIAFDREAGVLRAEAGASLADIIAFAAPRGFFPSTTPGTRFVTLGGAIANDVHGKNHHRAGTFGASVRRLCLLRAEGETEIGPDSPLFRATIGGLGLTGVILWAEIALARIASTVLDQETIAFASLDEFFNLAAESEAGFEHTVAWIDCLAAVGRGVFSRGNWAETGPRAAAAPRPRAAIPFDAPSVLLNRASLAAFNALYYRLGRMRAGASRIRYDRFFYPLDAIGGWNRLYGARGFYQYQSVVPPAAARAATRDMLAAIAAAGEGSFLAVLKTFGDRPSPGMLSFPMAGATLALDFANRGERTMRLLARLDEIVAAAGGRLYPAKDGRLPRAMFEQGYPQAEEFSRYVDPAMSSGFWRRMTG
ncbi:MAG: FAD-dependent oxidoreductase [Amphiplicatus sp.]